MNMASSPQMRIDQLSVINQSIAAVSSSQQNSSFQRPLTPAQAQLVLKAAKHWRGQHEQKINNKLAQIKNVKRSRDLKAESEIDELVARKVPFDLLAKDWINQMDISIGQRAYLLDKLIPTLVLAVEKLLTVAEKKGLIDSEKPSKDFNPINFLAQYLMRNNPRYSNFAEASPYARSIRKLLDDLKKDALNQEENRLAKMKLQAKKRKYEREKMDELNVAVVKGRKEALQELFLQWVEEKTGAIFLHLVQSALRSFKDYMTNVKEEALSEITFAKEIGETDMTGKMLGMNDFVQLILETTKEFTESIFIEFIKHMNHLATEYRMSEQLESVRLILANLFLACDHGDTGLLDRKRVLKLLETFYDNTKDPTIKSSLRNPRKWPVVDIDEQDEFIEEVIEEEKLDVENSFEKKQNMENQVIDNAVERENDVTSHEKQPEEDVDAKKDEDESEKKETQESNDLEKKADDTEEKSGEEDAKKKEEINEGENLEERKISANETSPKMPQDVKEIIIDRVSTAMDSSESPVKSSRAHSVATGSIFDPTTLNQAQFMNVLEKFLGELPSRTAVEVLVRYIRAGYIETEEERMARLEKARLEARSAKRRLKVDQLFDLWDVDGSGYLELTEVETVLLKWRQDASIQFKQASQVFEEAEDKISRKMFKKYIQNIVDQHSEEEEDCFDSLIAFLFASVERSFEERKRGEFRKKWLTAVNASAHTSAAHLDPVFKTVFQALFKDAEVHGRNKKTAAQVAFLEPNEPRKSKHAGANCLRYVACTADDAQFVLNKVLYRDMKNVSFTVIDSGKPIHVPRILHNGGVHLWNPVRKEEGIEGSLVMLPLRDHERQIIGVIGIDTLPDPHEKSVFVTHEISFYQGLAKALSSAVQFIDSRRKTIKIAESAVSWILRRSQHVKEVNIYLVEPGLKVTDGLVLRKMLTLRQNNNDIRFENPPRLERKDNLFRDYLFKCIDTSETLTADAYGERHTAFPLRDSEGMVVAIVDISIGEQRQLPVHESKEIHRMLKLLALAHKEVAREIAGEEKNIVLEVEKEHQEKRIDVLFDRIMLQDLRDNVGRLDARAFAEIKSYKDPPKLVHDIVKAVLEIYFGGKDDDEMAEKLDEWTTCKQLVNTELVNWISTFDPTASSNLALDGEKLAANLSNVPSGAVAKHGSLPAQYLFNWAFVCLSLIEHTSKMRDNRPAKEASQDSGEGTELEKTLPVEL